MSAKPDKKDIEDNKVIAALGYVSILCFVPLLFKRDSKFAQFHAKQGTVLFVVEIVSTIFIAFFGWLVFVAAVVMAIWGARAALDGKYWRMPVLGKLAEKVHI